MSNTQTETTMRARMVDALNKFYYDDDGDATVQEWREIAAESDEQLVDRVISLLEFYHEHYVN